MSLLNQLVSSFLIAIAVAPAASADAVLELSSHTIRQGAALGVTIHDDLAGPLHVRFGGRVWPVYRDRDRWRTYIGTDPATRPDAYTLAVESAGRIVARATVTVTAVAFAQRRLRLDPSTEALLTPQLVAEERRKVAAALRVLAAQQLWRGRFLLPSSAPVSSPYGVLSIYNGTVRGFHRGADFAAPRGARVRAANDGIVRLAERLPLSGNAVMIDHGVGILTTYFHMSRLNVRVGQRVHRGDVIGLVGSSGVATGPHLHWGLRTNGVYIDPLPWTWVPLP